MSITVEELKRSLPLPADLQVEARTLAEQDNEYHEYTENIAENFDIFKTEDGAGQEGYIFFYKQHGEVVAALLTAYDHESHTAPNIEDEEGAARQPVFRDVPDIFVPMLDKRSPVLWRYDGYPATFSHVFASAAFWTTGDMWETSDIEGRVDYQGNPISLDKCASEVNYVFKGFSFHV